MAKRVSTSLPGGSWLAHPQPPPPSPVRTLHRPLVAGGVTRDLPCRPCRPNSIRNPRFVQVHLFQGSKVSWEEWLPNSKDYPTSGADGEKASLLDYLRYVVIEVVVPDMTRRVVQWMDDVLTDLIQHLYDSGHPRAPTDKEGLAQWKEWVGSSVIMYVHNACVLEGVTRPDQLRMAAEAWKARRDNEKVGGQYGC